jgi:hypothetical protein
VIGLASLIEGLAALGLFPAKRFGHPGYKSGNWYPPVRATLAAGAVIATGSIRLLPFELIASATISDLAARVTTLAAAGNFQLAIYAMDPATKDPTGPALAATGDMSTAAAATVSADIVGANVVLPAGWYYMAINVDASAGGVAIFQTMSGSFNHAAHVMGSATLANISNSATNVALVKTIAQAYGTWPDLTAGGFAESAVNSSCVVNFKVA